MKPPLGDLLDRPLRARSRILLLAAALSLVPMYVAPLWNMTMFAPQYPDGLRLEIYSYKLEGGNRGQDIKEINLLNHYIGMHDLAAEDFTEFKWMPFAIGGLILLFLRAIVFGKLANLVDVMALFGYFGLFSLWSFVYKLYRYGHDLASNAAVKVPPFTPPIFGHTQMANFDVYSYPSLATYAMTVAGAALAASLFFAYRDAHRAIA